MIYQATRFLAELLKSPEVGYGVVFETAADLEAHRTPLMRRSSSTRTSAIAGWSGRFPSEDRPETNQRVYTYEALRAILPISVLLVEKDPQVPGGASP